MRISSSTSLHALDVYSYQTNFKAPHSGSATRSTTFTTSCQHKTKSDYQRRPICMVICADQKDPVNCHMLMSNVSRVCRCKSCCVTATSTTAAAAAAVVLSVCVKLHCRSRPWRNQIQIIHFTLFLCHGGGGGNCFVLLLYPPPLVWCPSDNLIQHSAVTTLNPGARPPRRDATLVLGKRNDCHRKYQRAVVLHLSFITPKKCGVLLAHSFLNVFIVSKAFVAAYNKWCF